MPKKLVWKSKTYRKRVRVPPNQFSRPRNKMGKDGYAHHGISILLLSHDLVHQDGTPCSYYCSCTFCFVVLK